MPSTSSSVSTVSTSFSSTQEHLLPSPSPIIPTIQSESLLKIPISTTTKTTSAGNNLNTSVSSLETETRSLTTPNKFAALSTEIQSLVPLPESVPTRSNNEHSNAPEIPQCVKRNSRNRRKRPKVQKPKIEIKLAPHRPRKSAPTECATDEEDMITYDVEEEELEPDPTVKFALKGPTNYPKGYLRALTPTRFRKASYSQDKRWKCRGVINHTLDRPREYRDEVHFWLNGYVNKQNYRIWSEANPQVYVETPLHPEKLTVWCASWAGGILL
ncbi:hypothetical protein TNCV_1399241 [Trichonephila clavipes]|nr:hypothetical protein TNCV_1399241 [Trichonephila clavipes]